MVLKKDKGHTIFHHQVRDVNTFTHQNRDIAVAAAQATISGNTSSFMKRKIKKNELLYPISPYDEIPAIRDLFKQLSPTPRQNLGVEGQRKELRQERQDNVKRNYSHGGRQQRDRKSTPVDTSDYVSRFMNDAHEVPIMIEMPTTPSYSKDSELSLEEEDYREQDPLTSHASCEFDFTYQPAPLYSRHLHEASFSSDWPSDEENALTNKTIITTKKRQNNAKKVRRWH